MNKFIDQVLDFHKTFNQPIGDPDQQMLHEDLKTRQLRIKLLFEELAELAVATDTKRTLVDLSSRFIDKMLEQHGGIEGMEEGNDYLDAMLDERGVKDGDNVDRVEELDALCDIQYVLTGKVITSGHHGRFDSAFDTVHRNNMTKAHKSVEHAIETAKAKGLGFHEIVIKGPGKVLLNDENGKLTKPHDHKKVKLTLH